MVIDATKIINALLNVLLGTDGYIYAVLTLAGLFGTMKILQKCGEKGWKAFIPCYNEFAVARCVSLEPEGRLLFISGIFIRLISCVQIFLPDEANDKLMLAVAVLIVYIIRFIYMIRLYSGLCDMFTRKHGWAILWAIADPVVAILWGFSGKFQPAWQLKDIDATIDTYFSSGKAAVMKDGLTVNLEERVAKEFMTKKTLLRDVHMNIAPGHMVLLLGGSGAGKTTLVNAINGYEPAKAEVFLNGQNIYKQYKHMQYEIGFVPQLDLMRGKDTVLHTLYDAAALRLPSEFSAAERHKRVDEVMGIFGLRPVKNNLVDKLSGGQRKRLSIAMEFISNPSLFILDEPDSGLDGVMARELMQQLRAIADQGKIVIVITHTPDRVIDLFDDVIVLAKDSNRTGRLAFFGPIKQAQAFFERDTMEHIVMCINRKEEGGEGRADEFINRFVEVQNGKAN